MCRLACGDVCGLMLLLRLGIREVIEEDCSGKCEERGHFNFQCPNSP